MIVSVFIIWLFFTTLHCEEISVTLPNVATNKEDAYICAWEKMSDDIKYVTKFKVMDAENVHHMIMYLCSNLEVSRLGYRENCQSVCNPPKIIFAWARNAPENKLPDNVGFPISKSQYLVVQVHFKDVQKIPSIAGMQMTLTDEMPVYMAGIITFIGNSVLEPGKEQQFIDVSCDYIGTTNIYPFAFRTHTHDLGRIVSGYQYNGTWNSIGKSNPQWPQTFWPSTTHVVVKPNDKLFARCRYDTTSMQRQVSIGATHNDEMCNFYVMYYYKVEGAAEMQTYCVGNPYSDIFAQYPASGSTLLPRNLDLEMMAEGKDHHHHHDDQISGEESDAEMHHDHMSAETSDAEMQCPTYELDPFWPKNLKFGQVSAVAIHPAGNIYIFHRSSVVWDSKSFDSQHHFKLIDEGPIVGDTIIEIDMKNGTFVRSFGSGFFYMPHGFHIDEGGNFWFTDVAMHQVFKFPASSNSTSFKPSLTVGEKFEQGSNAAKFCKPSDIAVLRNGDFFVADGYCNTRVQHFDSRGNLVESHDFKSSNVLHSLALDEANMVVYVADRENKRVLKLNWMTKLVDKIEMASFEPAVYAVSYSPVEKLLFAVNYGQQLTSIVTIINADKEKMCGFIAAPKDNPILSPHDMQATEDGSHVYIAEFMNVNGIKKKKVPTATLR